MGVRNENGLKEMGGRNGGFGDRKYRVVADMNGHLKNNNEKKQMKLGILVG